MNKVVKSLFKSQSIFSKKKFLVFISLLFMVSLVFSCFISVFSDVSSFAIGMPVKIVGNEAELKNAISTAQTGSSVVIALDNNITLTETLTITAKKDITLTSNRDNGFYALIGADGDSTITVDGEGLLVLDGVIVTHVNSGKGSGVVVGQHGQFIMNSGEISGNIADFGGGVCNRGVFNMTGGVISNNLAFAGGGVNNWHYFNMTGGTLTHNTAEYGGGVYNNPIRGIFFDRRGGIISGNTAMYGDSDVNDVFHDVDGAGSSGNSGGSSNENGDISNGFIVPLKPNSAGYNETISEKNSILFGGFGVWVDAVVCVCVGVAVFVVAILLFYRLKRQKTTRDERFC
jgi:hypothetical protein